MLGLCLWIRSSTRLFGILLSLLRLVCIMDSLVLLVLWNPFFTALVFVVGPVCLVYLVILIFIGDQ